MATMTEIFAQLVRLHLARTWAYHDSWRRDGEVDPVTNILRKTDRLRGVLSRGVELTLAAEGPREQKWFERPVRTLLSWCLAYLNLPQPMAKTEGLCDTIADAGVYAGKYLTFLAATYPAAFCRFFRVPDAAPYVFRDRPDQYPADEIGEGFYAVVRLLLGSYQARATALALVLEAKTLADCLAVINRYEPIVHAIKRGDMHNEPREEKFLAGVSICMAAVKALTFITSVQPGLWDAYIGFIDKEWQGLAPLRRREYSLPVF